MLLKKKSKKRILFLVVCTVFLFVLFFPYLKAEVLTNLYGEEFDGLEQQTRMLDSASYHKVVEYSETQAKVFYVSDSGDLLTFKKNDDGSWELSNWKTIWSNSGSADEFYWPYYR